MKTLTTAVAFLGIASAALAQGRGGRQGGPGNAAPQPRCLNPNMTAGIQITKGQPIAEQFGVDPANGVIVIRPNGDASQFIQPCANFATDDPLAKYFFPPDQIMGHQGDLGITDEQRKFILATVVAAQAKILTTQFKLAAEVERLQTLLQAPTVDEAKVLEQVDRVLPLERDIKREQLSLMIRLKNQLTPQQRETLMRLRAGG